MDTTLNRPRGTVAVPTAPTLVPGRSAIIAGRVLSGLVAAALALDSLGKLLQVQPVIDATTQLGYPADLVFPVGLTLLLCVLTYLVPASSVLGGLLLTGYLGGAVATHVRVGSPLFSHVLTPVYLAIALWIGLVLRDPRLRALLPGRRSA